MLFWGFQLGVELRHSSIMQSENVLKKELCVVIYPGDNKSGLIICLSELILNMLVPFRNKNTLVVLVEEHPDKLLPLYPHASFLCIAQPEYICRMNHSVIDDLGNIVS